MKAELLDVLGSDLTVVNAARVSFSKESKEFNDKDASLIAFLAKHKHLLPFRHPQLSFRCSAPVFVARQLGKYQVGMSWSEESRRYISETPMIFVPQVWRKAAKDKKQGSLDEPVDQNLSYRFDGSGTLDKRIQRFNEIAAEFYEELIDHGVAPEQARMVLPQSTYINWIWTGSLLAYANICNERLKPDAQKETRDFVKMIYEVLKEKFPVSTKELIHV